MFYLGKIKIYNAEEHPFEKNVLIEHQNKDTLKESFAKSISELFFSAIGNAKVSSSFSEVEFGNNQAMIRIISIEPVDEQFVTLNGNKLINLSA